MITNKSSLIYATRPPLIQPSGKAPALVLLHGRGSDENDLIGLAEYLDERLYIISIRAPYPWTHGPGFTWFDIEDIGSPNPAMFTESHKKLSVFLRNLPVLFPVDHARITLCGFSMGAMMSYAVALTEPELVNGTIALSGLIPKSSVDPDHLREKITGKLFFVAHGVHDSVIPVALGRKARDILTDAAAHVTYREYDMDHQIGEETLNDVIKWMDDLLNPPHDPPSRY